MYPFTLGEKACEGPFYCLLVGESGAIAGKINPDLEVNRGAVVQINLVNGDGAMHDIVIPELGAKSDKPPASTSWGSLR
ncbi:MAG: hypothetical protein ABS69_08660 [Nitrosomonadales bacterium SCN 54-20]|nr:MAG: hypothetical protein ABS69_08660 [Nitrosomonadales bacterium SCN 54-20]